MSCRVSPTNNYEAIKSIAKMMECRKWYLNVIEKNRLFEDYLLRAFMVEVKFAIDFLQDMDMLDQSTYYELSNNNRFHFEGQHFIMDLYDGSQCRFHYSCTFSNILINLINHLNII